MIVTAALCWWDEPVALLAECVRGVAKVADRLIAFDGAYRRYPGATVSSPVEQAEAITATASAEGLDCEIVVPTDLWAGQVAKREAAIRRASQGTDWWMILDADWIIHTDRAQARAALEAQTYPVVNVTFWTPPASVYATNWHRDIAGMRYGLPHFFRPFADLRVENHHGWYSALHNGERVWIFEDPGFRYRSLGSAPLGVPYEVEHRCNLRDEAHILAGRAFCNDRVMVVAQTGQEDDIPGLPAPVWDYTTVPY